jgi:CHAT domain-containing protein
MLRQNRISHVSSDLIKILAVMTCLLTSIVPSLGGSVLSLQGFSALRTVRHRTYRISITTPQEEVEALELLKQGQALADEDTIESHRKAIAKFNQALKLLRASRRKLESNVANLFEAQLLYSLAESENALGEYQSQLEHARQAFALKPDDPETLINIMISLGSALSSLGQHGEALEIQAQALEIINSPTTVLDKDVAGEMRSAILGVMCVTHSYLGDRRKALDTCNQALNGASSEGKMVLLRVIAQAYSELGERNNAIRSVNELLLLSRDSHNQLREGDALVTMGGVYNALGEKQAALDSYKRALSIMEAVAGPEKQAQALAGVGAVYADLGFKDEALSYLGRSLQLVNTKENSRLVANVLGYVGAVYESTGHYDEALKAYSRALALARKETIFTVNDVEALLLLRIGSLYLSLGDTTKGVNYLTQALPAFKKLGDRDSQFVVANKVADAVDSLGDTTRALEFYNRAVELGRGLEGKEAKVATLFALAKVHYLSGDNARTLETLTQALDVEKEIGGKSGQAKLLHSIGSIYMTSGDCNNAMKYFDQALTFERDVADRQNEGSTLELIASCQEKAGKLEVALDTYQKAIKVEEKVRTDSQVNEFRMKLSGESTFAYMRAVLINLRLGRAVDAFNLSERARARTFLDQLAKGRIDLRRGGDSSSGQKEQKLRFELKDLGQRLRSERSKPQPQRSETLSGALEKQLAAKQLEYESFLNELELQNLEYGSMVGVNPLNLQGVQELLEKDTTLISFFLTEEKILAFVTTHDSFDAIELSVKLNDLLDEIARFRSFSNKNDAYPNSLKQLYSMLIAPLEPYIKTRMIGIVPHSALHYVPFAALCKDSSYFGDDHTIYYLPSASVIPFVKQKRKPVGGRLLVMAQDQAEGFPVLSYGKRLAEDVAGLYMTRAFTNRRATESTLRARAAQSSIVLLAAHGKLNSASPLFSQIVLSPDKANDGVLEVHEVYGLDLKNAGLVVLTACNTALGGHTEGDDIVGLNRAFIYAGTPTILATLWSVPEESTADLTRAFFKHLKGGKSKVEALQAAQSEVKKKYPNPYYWAAFVLTGDPGSSDAEVLHRPRRRSASLRNRHLP